MIETYIFIITININGLNPSAKRHRLAKWIKTKTHLYFGVLCIPHQSNVGSFNVPGVSDHALICFYSALSQLFPPFHLSAHVSVLLPQLFCYWFHLVDFSFHLLCCSSLIVVSSSRFLLNIYCIILIHASILFLRSWNLRKFQNPWNLIFTATSLHSFPGRLPAFKTHFRSRDTYR